MTYKVNANASNGTSVIIFSIDIFAFMAKDWVGYSPVSETYAVFPSFWDKVLRDLSLSWTILYGCLWKVDDLLSPTPSHFNPFFLRDSWDLN